MTLDPRQISLSACWTLRTAVHTCCTGIRGRRDGGHKAKHFLPCTFHYIQTYVLGRLVSLSPGLQPPFPSQIGLGRLTRADLEAANH